MHAKISMRTQLSKCTCRPNLAHVQQIPETKQDKFSTLNLRFEMNPTSSRSHSKPLFLHYKQPYMVYFQNTQKSHRKTLRFTKNSELKMKFFTKHHQVNFLLIRAFSGLDLLSIRLLITLLFDCEQIWLNETVKNQS